MEYDQKCDRGPFPFVYHDPGHRLYAAGVPCDQRRYHRLRRSHCFHAALPRVHPAGDQSGDLHRRDYRLLCPDL